MSAWGWSRARAPKPGSVRATARVHGLPEATVQQRVARGETLEEAVRDRDRTSNRKPPPSTWGIRSSGGKASLSPEQFFWNYVRSVLGKEPLYEVVEEDDAMWDSWRGLERAASFRS